VGPDIEPAFAGKYGVRLSVYRATVSKHSVECNHEYSGCDQARSGRTNSCIERMIIGDDVMGALM
jgi:hypothetical protein